MAIDRDYVAANKAELARLRMLVARWSDTDLTQAMPAGWTVAGVLMHLAFWDNRAVVLLHRWQRQGVVPPPEDEADVDWINDASKPLFLAVHPRKAVEFAVSSADAADGMVAQLPEELVERNVELGTPVSLKRAAHRKLHLDDIERVLRDR